MMRLLGLHCLAFLAAALFLAAAPAMAANLTFTVATSEPAIVTGTPRIAIDVGGITRYATYVSGTGSSALVFSYAVQQGDFDADGIAVASPIELDGGTIVDAAGNPLSDLAFTIPATANVKVLTYAAAFSAISNANASAASFTILKAPAGGSFSYTITTTGGANVLTGSGTISGLAHTVSGLDLSNFPQGTLSLSVTVSTPAGGTGAARSATATPSFTGVLDGLPATAASFSLRRLASAYTGPLVRVRRSSDNAEQDIGATIGGNLDTAALASFCGSASCFVRTLYDQSGSANHASQGSTSSQPRIFNAAATEVEGARPAMRYTAVGQLLLTSAPVGQTIQATLNAVARNADSSSQRHVLGDRGTGANFGRIIRASVGGGSYLGANIGGAIVTYTGSTLQQRVITFLAAATGVSGAYDGVFAAGGNNSFYATSGIGLWVGGGGWGQSATGDWIGTISEVTVFSSTLSTANRQTLERNQGAWYGITVQ